MNNDIDIIEHIIIDINMFENVLINIFGKFLIDIFKNYLIYPLRLSVSHVMYVLSLMN